MKIVVRTAAIALWAASLLIALGPGLSAQSVTPVPKLDLDRFTGTWYEIARFPIKREKSCVGDVFEVIAAGNKPNQLLLVNSCKTKGGYPGIRNGYFKASDKSGDGKLKLIYTWPFSTGYWVLALGPDYDWALVGSPNHKHLWVLSRSPALQPDVLAAIEARAAAEGFPSASLALTPQTPNHIESAGAKTAVRPPNPSSSSGSPGPQP